MEFAHSTETGTCPEKPEKGMRAGVERTAATSGEVTKKSMLLRPAGDEKVCADWETTTKGSEFRCIHSLIC